MSDMTKDMIRRMQLDDLRLRQTETKEIPPLYLPWTQVALNPFPLAAAGTLWGTSGQPWPVLILAFYCSVFVNTTNNATNFWTIVLNSNPGGATIASFTTAAIAVGTWTRVAVTAGIVQPASTQPAMSITPTATLNPGSIYIVPAVALLRTGN